MDSDLEVFKRMLIRALIPFEIETASTIETIRKYIDEGVTTVLEVENSHGFNTRADSHWMFDCNGKLLKVLHNT